MSESTYIWAALDPVEEEMLAIMAAEFPEDFADFMPIHRGARFMFAVGRFLQLYGDPGISLRRCAGGDFDYRLDQLRRAMRNHREGAESRVYA
jgi:hypothetical protein